MLKLNGIKPSTGSTKTAKRVGRGNGSGKGTFCGRGMNGQNCRSGGGVPAWFEGGQTPLFRRMPKLKGFSNARFMKEYNIINLSDLEILAQKGITTINKEVLLENRIIRDKNLGVKLLGNGELTTKVEVSVNKLSKTAKEALDKLGAKVEITE
ncbi:MAG: 50S ribosomal protein L15 [Candidatus Gracilibacteria bacterium]|nr:50S ribosomal protein L15 [Candidatus Gracilibacteria bacterium]